MAGNQGRSAARGAAQRHDRVRALLGVIQEILDDHPRALSSRGNGYLGRVSDFSWSARERELECHVQGSESWPYSVVIGLTDDLQGISYIECSCPYGETWGLCKHTFAVFEKLAERLSLPNDPVRRWLTGEVPQHAWQELLGCFDRFAAIHQAESAQRPRDDSRRLAWRIEIRKSSIGSELAPVPYDQHRNKGGNWTVGRRVSWERLGSERELATSPIDQRIYEYLRDRAITQGEYYFSYSGRFEPNPIQILELLVGHPHVTWADDRGRRVTIEKGTIGLRVESREKDLAVMPAMNGVPLLLAGDTFLHDRDTVAAGEKTGIISADRDTGLIRVAEVDQALLELIQELLDVNDGVTLPPEGHETLFARLAELESQVGLPIAYDDTLVSGTIEAERAIVLRLEPSETAGLAAELKVRPAENGPTLEPGQGPAEISTAHEGKRARVCRDLADETKRAGRIRDYLGLGRHVATRAWSWRIMNDDEALDLIAATNDYDGGDLMVEWPEDARLSVSREITSQSLRVEISDRQDWFGLSGTIEVDGQQIPLAALLEAIRGGRRYVGLGKNQFLRIAEALRARLASLADVVHPSKGGLEVDVTAAPILDDLLDHEVQLNASKNWRQLQQKLAEATELSPEPPITLQAQLRDYQLEGYRWMRRLAAWGVGGCLADDMGLGKTVQALAVLIDRMEEGPALVVAPTSVGFNWVREAERFAPTLRPLLYRETDRDLVFGSLGDGDLVVISYGLLLRDVEKLKQVPWGTLIFDEAQQIKNAHTKTARAARLIESKWRLALTGTPVENHLGELWSLFRATSPGLFGSWDRFRERFAEPIEKRKDAERRHALSRVVRPFILRRTKAEVLDELPPRTEVLRNAEMSPGELKLYEEARLKAAVSLSGADRDDSSGDKRFKVLAALTKLRQLACHPKLVDANWKHGSAKLSLFLEIVDELREGGHRALVFSQFTQHLDLLREALDAREIGYQYLDGQTNPRQRTERVDAFQRGEGELFLISLKAGGTGLNLTAADYVIHMDPWWNPAVEDQATDRAHRMGQTRPVTVYRIVTKGTIEEQILALHADKRDLVAGVLDGTDKAGKLSTEELVAMIRGENPVAPKPQKSVPSGSSVPSISSISSVPAPKAFGRPAARRPVRRK